LLQHIIIETERSIRAEENEPNNIKEALKAAYVVAFHNAQVQFGCHRDPPAIEELKRKKRRSSSILERLLHGKSKTPKQGGSTACTLSIVRDFCVTSLFGYVAGSVNKRLIQFICFYFVFHSTQEQQKSRSP
jgi:hypothetical protein